MFRKRVVGSASIGHSLWLCTKCNKELHGILELDYHNLKKHNIPTSEVLTNYFESGQLKALPSCMFLIEDCRKERKVDVTLLDRKKWSSKGDT